MSEMQRLSDRVAELEEILGLTASFPRGMFPEGTFKLRTCEPLLGLLLARKFVPHEAAYDVLFGGRPECDQPCLDQVKMAICYLRKGLAVHGIKINTIFGRGYFINDENKALLRNVIECDQQNLAAKPLCHTAVQAGLSPT